MEFKVTQGDKHNNWKTLASQGKWNKLESILQTFLVRQFKQHLFKLFWVSNNIFVYTLNLGIYNVYDDY